MPRLFRLGAWAACIALIVCCALPVLSAPQDRSSRNVPPALHVDGNRLKTSDGRVVRLQGVNIPSIEWSNAGEHLLQSLQVATQDWKANAIRLPLCQDRWFGMQKEQNDGGLSYRQIVADFVNAAAARHCYVILDLHWSDGGVWGHYLGQHSMPDQNSVVFWQEVAQRFSNNSAVLFGLYNEPKDVTWEIWKNGGLVAEREGNDAAPTVYETPGLQKLIERIRAVGANNVVVAGGLDWAYDLSGVDNGFALADTKGNGIVYDTHVYPWKKDWDNKFGKTAEQHPVLLGEVGCEPDPKQEDPYKWAPRILDYIQQHQLNWTAWTFHIGASPRLLLDWNYTPTPYWGAFVKQALTGVKLPAPGQTAVPQPGTTATIANPDAKPKYIFGALQNDVRRLKQDYAAGLRLAVLELGWNRYEPQDGVFNKAYISEVKAKLQAYQDAGFQTVLDFGLQYPPQWAFNLPNSRYVNQYGDSFVDAAAGMNGVNAVFNQALRNKQAAYVQRVFADLGNGFYAVRLGWGWYSELNYPPTRYKDHANCYWAYDALAQGRSAGLPVGIPACPVPVWSPGTPSPNHTAPAQFLNWYLDSLKNYHDWQIVTVRRYYPGRLAMLYPSWGIRPGQVDAAIATDLNGSTSPERNGEVQRGFDFARFIQGINDSNVIVYCTWIDANATVADENSPDQARWSPVHYLSYLAQQHALHLKVWGENTGQNDEAAMQRSFQRMKDYGLMGIMWAFEGQLYDGQYATLDQYAKLILQY
ncbi:MAG: cellulase family glycosylhydrolase [Abitibacteriaceae bacterium]|nr:cellulase family glycosylhydrolase [Abditibacteriaceae bacterium]